MRSRRCYLPRQPQTAIQAALNALPRPSRSAFPGVGYGWAAVPVERACWRFTPLLVKVE